MADNQSKVAEVLRSLINDRMITSGLKVFRAFCACGRQADHLCDWKVAKHKTGTCDKPICAQHAKQVVPAKFLCPEHQLTYESWQTRRKFSVSQQRNLFEGAA